jgi:hypothetical protein
MAGRVPGRLDLLDHRGLLAIQGPAVYRVQLATKARKAIQGQLERPVIKARLVTRDQLVTRGRKAIREPRQRKMIPEFKADSDQEPTLEQLMMAVYQETLDIKRHVLALEERQKRMESPVISRRMPADYQKPI